MIAAITALFRAAAAFLKVWPLLKIHSLDNEIQAMDNEMLVLADRGDAASKLQLELLAKHRERKAESIRYLRSIIGNSDQGA